MQVSHGQGEQLAQAIPGVTTPVTLFSVPLGGLRTEITLITIGIHNSGNKTVRMFHDDDGTTFDDTTEIFHQVLSQSSPNLIFQAQHPGSGIHVKPGGAIGLEVSVASDVTVTMYGITETLAERVRGLSQ